MIQFFCTIELRNSYMYYNYCLAAFDPVNEMPDMDGGGYDDDDDGDVGGFDDVSIWIIRVTLP